MEQAMDWDENLLEEEDQDEDRDSNETPTVFTQSSDPTISGLFEDMTDGVLEVQPDFQRGYVWDDARASRLVESVLLSIPLPTIYLAEEDNGKKLVIDGQQRLTTFKRFRQGELVLSRLKSRSDLNGKYYRDLSREDQSIFKSFPIRTITIRRQSDPELKFELFHRINTGSVALNDQELRNCVYRGPYNELLKELSGGTIFKTWFQPKSLDRMKDVELVLRFAAFHHTHYSRYSSLRKFLNDEMKQNQQIDERTANELRSAFRKSVDLSHSLLGEYGFRRFIPGEDGSQNGEWSKTASNALFDVVMHGFTHYSKSQVYPHLDAVRESLLWLMTSDEGFIKSIDNTTGSRPRVQVRFGKWLETLKDVLGDPITEPRSFSRTLKEQLYGQNPDCTVCGARISHIDDAAIDHIEQYWRGGQTVPENARLTHRYCNNARSRHD